VQHTFSHKFETATGVLVHVPTKYGLTRGYEIVDAVLARWRPPAYFYHFRPGGHVAACRHHLTNPCFARLDIKSFFGSVTRTKVHRALRRIGVSQDDAFAFASTSTVLREGERGRYALPFGFVQSMVLASVALDRSLVGQRLLAAHRPHIKVSVYVDDIILSARQMAPLLEYVNVLVATANAAGFQFNPSKTLEPSIFTEAFNINVSQGTMCVTSERLAVFEREMHGQNRSRIDAVIAYVGTVNKAQAAQLSQCLEGRERQTAAP
jgi:hypothetical protein